MEKNSKNRYPLQLKIGEYARKKIRNDYKQKVNNYSFDGKNSNFRTSECSGPPLPPASDFVLLCRTPPRGGRPDVLYGCPLNYTPFFLCKNTVYKNIEGSKSLKIKNILRIRLRLKSHRYIRFFVKLHSFHLRVRHRVQHSDRAN